MDRDGALAALVAGFTRSDGAPRFDASSTGALFDVVAHLDATRPAALSTSLSTSRVGAALSPLWAACARGDVAFAEIARVPDIASRVLVRADGDEGDDDDARAARVEGALVRIGIAGAQCAIADAAIEARAHGGRYAWVVMYALEHARRMERIARREGEAEAALAAILHAGGAVAIVDGVRKLKTSIDARALLHAIDIVHAWASSLVAQAVGAPRPVVNALATHEDDDVNGPAAAILAEADRVAARFARIPSAAAKAIRPHE